MQDIDINLNLLKPNTLARVIKINSTGDIKRRLLDLGLVENSFIECVFESPFKDPRAYNIKGATIAIRNSDACNIIVRSIVHE